MTCWFGETNAYAGRRCAEAKMICAVFNCSVNVQWKNPDCEGLFWGLVRLECLYVSRCSTAARWPTTPKVCCLSSNLNWINCIMQPGAFSLCVFVCGLTCLALWSCWREHREERISEHRLCLRLANTAVPASLRHPSVWTLSARIPCGQTNHPGQHSSGQFMLKCAKQLLVQSSEGCSGERCPRWALYPICFCQGYQYQIIKSTAHKHSLHLITA